MEPTDNQEIEAAELAVRGLDGVVSHVVVTDPEAQMPMKKMKSV